MVMAAQILFAQPEPVRRRGQTTRDEQHCQNEATPEPPIEQRQTDREYEPFGALGCNRGKIAENKERPRTVLNGIEWCHVETMLETEILNIQMHSLTGK